MKQVLTHNRLYLGCVLSSTICTFDLDTNQGNNTFAPTSLPQGLALNPVTHRLFVSSGSKVTVLNTDDNSTVGDVPLPNNVQLQQIGANSQTNRVYVDDLQNNRVLVIDPRFNVVSDTIAVGTQPEGILVDAPNHRLYVTNTGDNTVSVIDTNSNTTLATVGVGRSPLGLALNSTLGRVYVANYGDNTVSVINTISNSVSITIGVGTYPSRLAVNPATNEVFVVNGGDHSISVIQETTPLLKQSFEPANVPLHGTSRLTLALSNPTTTTLTNLSFVDSLAVSLTTASAVTTNCPGGTATLSGPVNSTISLSGATLQVGQSCLVGVDVRSEVAGQWVSSLNSFSSNENGSVSPVNGATLLVSPLPPPTLQLHFSPNTIKTGDPSTLTFTLDNSNVGSTQTNVSFELTLPAALVIVDPANPQNNCLGSEFLAQVGSHTITVRHVNLDPRQVCTLSVDMIGQTPGSWFVPVNQISSDQSGTTDLSGVGDALNVSVNNPLPNLTGLVPASAVAGSSALMLTLNGANFVNGAVAQWNGSARPTTFVSDSQLLVSITTNDLAAVQSASINVFNPGLGGGLSVAQTFLVTSQPNLTPSLVGLSPTSVFTGGAAFTLTVSGKNFVNGAIVQWNGNERPTTFVNGDTLVANIGALDITQPGIGIVTVANPGAAASSNLKTVNINPATNPVPGLSPVGLPPALTAGGPSFSLAVNGSNFVANSVVRWNNSDRVTTYISSTQLVADISASDIAITGTVLLSVFNPGPGGGVSGNEALSIVSDCVATVVTTGVDDNSCGSLRAALAAPGYSPAKTRAVGTDKPIYFGLLRSSTITLNQPLVIPPNTSLNGVCTTSGPAITLTSGASFSGDGLLLDRGDILRGLRLEGFGGRSLIAQAGGGNQLSCVVVRK